MNRVALALAVMLIAALASLAACGARKQRAGDRIAGRTLTIYASAPLHGASAVDGQAVLGGERLALAQLRSRIGKYRIVLLALDDSTVQRGGWDPGQTTTNARLAVANPTTIGYLGELDSGASAISIPVLNRAGIAQISATSTAVGLTSSGPGASPGEPQKYYPAGVRTFARVMPNDSVQSIAQVRLQQSQGCKKTFVLDDGEVDGYDAATSFQVAAGSLRLALAGVQGFDPQAADYTSLARGVAATGADCVLINAAPESNAVLLTEQIAAALPNAMIFGSAGLAESTYTNPALGGIPALIDQRVSITAAALGPRDYPVAGRAFLSAYTKRFGKPQPDAIYGYEAMSLMLAAITRATRRGTLPAERSKVLSAIFSTHDRAGAVGTYSIDHNGDTTIRRFGAYRVVAGQLEFWQPIDA
jgi:branched-chain amino acid transport system substrate-binding protein